MSQQGTRYLEEPQRHKAQREERAQKEFEDDQRRCLERIKSPSANYSRSQLFVSKKPAVTGLRLGHKF